MSEIESRVRQLKNICRKYGPDLTDAIALYQKLQSELNKITDSGQSITALQQEYELTLANLIKECEKLNKLRQKAATKLEKQLVKELKPLAMDKVIFECRLEPSKPTATGADKVVFYFSPQCRGNRSASINNCLWWGNESFFAGIKSLFYWCRRKF